MKINLAGTRAQVLCTAAFASAAFALPIAILPPAAHAAASQSIRITADENSKITAAIRQSQTDLMALQRDTKTPMSGKRAKFVSIMSKQKSRVLSILRPDQRMAVNKVDQLNKEIQQSLTPAQKQNMQAKQNEFGSQIAKVANDKSLSDSNKMAKANQLRAAGQASIVSLLDAKQRAKYDEIQNLQKQMQYKGAK